MKKWSWMLAGIGMAILIFGGTTGFAASKGSKDDDQCYSSSLEKSNFFLKKCPRGSANPDGFYLIDHGKQVRFPFTGNTIIDSVSPFLSLTAPYPSQQDILVVERDTKNYSLAYLTAYKYEKGKFTKLDSIKNNPPANDRELLTEFLFSDDGGYTVYLQELKGAWIATKVYGWNKDLKKFVLIAASPNE